MERAEMILTGDWQVIKSTQDGDILVMDDGYRIRVSFPDEISEDAVRDALSENGVHIGCDVVFESGEREGETVGFFSKS